MAVEMTDLMAQLLASALEDGVPCLVGTSGQDGRPQISPKGSLALYDRQTLCFWERSFRGVHKHIAANPQVVVFYRNYARASEMSFTTGGALRFHGRARVVDQGPGRERVWQLSGELERARDPQKKGVAVLIEVEKIEQLNGVIVMQREASATS